MITSVAAAPASAAVITISDARARRPSGELGQIPDNTPPTHDVRSFSRDSQPSRGNGEGTQTSEAPAARSGSTMFAAAVIGGSLPPQPQSMSELFRRIGISEIPPESEARLKDILA